MRFIFPKYKFEYYLFKRRKKKNIKQIDRVNLNNTKKKSDEIRIRNL